MEIKLKKLLHPFKNLSLKWSFMLYVVVCAFIALLLTICLSGLFSVLRSNIYNYYRDLYKDEMSKEEYLIVDKGLLKREHIWVYTQDIKKKFSDIDSFLYDLYAILSVLVIPVILVLCVLFTGILFYFRKIKTPLTILDNASSRIKNGDLDFKVKYESLNEFGRLAVSFETMRESLYEANRDMWRMMEERKRLNAAFAHDLRTPLTVLRGYCDFLLKYVPDGKIDSKKTITTLSTMDVYLKRLEGYTFTMSSLQKLEEIELSPMDVNFSDLCEELKDIVGILSKEKNIEFTCHGNGLLCVDMYAVCQVFENLIANAVRFAKNNVKVYCDFKDILSITVVDDGVGFSVEAIKNATEPYFQENIDISDTTHFGIGLYICRLLCEKHNGSLNIEISSSGKVTAKFAPMAI